MNTDKHFRKNLKALTKKLIQEEKSLKREKKIEHQRYANWNKYYTQHKLKWLKRARLDDKKANKTIKLTKQLIDEAKEEIKRIEKKYKVEQDSKKNKLTPF